MSEMVSIVEDRRSGGMDSSTRMSTLETLAELNNEGASHLENSLYSEAIATFTVALTIAMKNETHLALELRASGMEQVSSHHPLGNGTGVGSSAGISSSENTEGVWAGQGDSNQETVKPKKLRRRKHKRRNSLGSTSSGGKESSITRLSRRERRRREHHHHHHNSTTSRRARSAMGRLSITNGETMGMIVTEDVEHTPQKYIHSKPLRIWDRYNIPSGMELAIYLVYNLALANHLQAIQLGTMAVGPVKRGGPRWSRIIELYQLTTRLMEQQHQRLEEGPSDDVVVDPRSPLWSPTYTVALPNNLACAYHSSGNDEKADEAWRQVLSHIWCLLDLGCTSQVECFSQLLENAAHLMDPNPVGRTATAA